MPVDRLNGEKPTYTLRNQDVVELQNPSQSKAFLHLQHHWNLLAIRMDCLQDDMQAFPEIYTPLQCAAQKIEQLMQENRALFKELQASPALTINQAKEIPNPFLDKCQDFQHACQQLELVLDAWRLNHALPADGLDLQNQQAEADERMQQMQSRMNCLALNNQQLKSQLTPIPSKEHQILKEAGERYLEHVQNATAFCQQWIKEINAPPLPREEIEAAQNKDDLLSLQRSHAQFVQEGHKAALLPTPQSKDSLNAREAALVRQLRHPNTPRFSLLSLPQSLILLLYYKVFLVGYEILRKRFSH